MKLLFSLEYSALGKIEQNTWDASHSCCDLSIVMKVGAELLKTLGQICAKFHKNFLIAARMGDVSGGDLYNFL